MAWPSRSATIRRRRAGSASAHECRRRGAAMRRAGRRPLEPGDDERDGPAPAARQQRATAGHRLAYGLPIGARFVGTPRAGVRASEHGRDYRVGYGMQVLQRGRLNLQLGIDAERRESQSPPAGAERRNRAARTRTRDRAVVAGRARAHHKPDEDGASGRWRGPVQRGITTRCDREPQQGNPGERAQNQQLSAFAAV